MCKYASFFHNPHDNQVCVKVLDSHGETEKELNLNLEVWREGHYTPEGEVELRLTEDDRVDPVEYETAFRNRFPTFNSFIRWANTQNARVERLSLDSLKSVEGLDLPKSVEVLHLNSLTSVEGLDLPESVERLSLDSLTSVEGLALPESVEWLSLNSLTSVEGLDLPKSVKWLYLDSLTSVEGLDLPESVERLSLDSLTSVEGLALPESVKVLSLNSLKSVDKEELRKKYPNTKIY
jgi:hypothetical protein